MKALVITGYRSPRWMLSGWLSRPRMCARWSDRAEERVMSANICAPVRPMPNSVRPAPKARKLVNPAGICGVEFQTRPK